MQLLRSELNVDHSKERWQISKLLWEYSQKSQQKNFAELKQFKLTSLVWMWSYSEALYIIELFSLKAEIQRPLDLDPTLGRHANFWVNCRKICNANIFFGLNWTELNCFLIDWVGNSASVCSFVTFVNFWEILNKVEMLREKHFKVVFPSSVCLFVGLLW